MDAESNARLEKVEASMTDLAAAVKLLTDGQQEIKGLLTDTIQHDVRMTRLQQALDAIQDLLDRGNGP